MLVKQEESKSSEPYFTTEAQLHHGLDRFKPPTKPIKQYCLL